MAYKMKLANRVHVLLCASKRFENLFFMWNYSLSSKLYTPLIQREHMPASLARSSPPANSSEPFLEPCPLL